MVKLHHIRQLAVKSETTSGEGVAETSFAATDLVRVAELTLDQRPNAYERPLHTGGFGYVPRHYATGTCELSFVVEMAGNSDNAGGTWSSTPKFGTLLKGCGMFQRATLAVDLTGAITGGPFQAGETITGGTSANTAAITSDVYTGATQISVHTISGAFTSGEELTGSTSGATVDVGATELGANQNGYFWRPLTEETSNQSMTIRLYNDGDLITVYGARGTVDVDCQSQDIGKLRFTIQGIYSSTTATALLDDTATGAFDDLTPPAFVNVTATLNDGTTSTTPKFTELQLSLGNNVAMRKNANSASGWQAAVIANRTPSGRINPDDPGATAHDFRDAVNAGTRFRLGASWGTSEHNRFEIKCPAIEFDSLGDSERDEVQSFDGNFRVTRGFEYGADDNSPCTDQELLIFHT